MSLTNCAVAMDALAIFSGHALEGFTNTSCFFCVFLVRINTVCWDLENGLCMRDREETNFKCNYALISGITLTET